MRAWRVGVDEGAKHGRGRIGKRVSARTQAGGQGDVCARKWRVTGGCVQVQGRPNVAGESGYVSARGRCTWTRNN